MNRRELFASAVAAVAAPAALTAKPDGEPKELELVVDYKDMNNDLIRRALIYRLDHNGKPTTEHLLANRAWVMSNGSLKVESYVKAEAGTYDLVMDTINSNNWHVEHVDACGRPMYVRTSKVLRQLSSYRSVTV